MRGGGAEIKHARVERSQRRADHRDVLGRFLESPRPLRGACSLRTDGSREGRRRDGACAARSGPALQPVAAPLFGGAQRSLRAAALSHQGRDHVEVALTIEPVLDGAGDRPATLSWCSDLTAMYRAWA